MLQILCGALYRRAAHLTLQNIEFNHLLAPKCMHLYNIKYKHATDWLQVIAEFFYRI